jgi:RHS repeat-associated protein
LNISNLCISYYPFGSTQEGLNFVSTALTDNDLVNKYLFGGKEQDSKTGFFEYHYRQYDSWLGRWHVQDPLAEFYATQSPYHFAGNNPINNYEANGAYYYMSPFDSKNFGDDDDGFSFDIGDGLGSDGGGGRGWSGGGSKWKRMGLNATEPARPTYQHTPYVYPNRNPLNGYVVPGETHGEGWMPRDRAGGGTPQRRNKGNIIVTPYEQIANRVNYDPKNENWDAILITDLLDAYNQLSAFENIRHLVFDSHGGEGFLSLDFDEDDLKFYITEEGVRNYRDLGTTGLPTITELIEDLDKIASLVSKTITFLGCESATGSNNVIRELSTLDGFRDKNVMGNAAITSVIRNKKGPLNASLIFYDEYTLKQGTFRNYKNGRKYPNVRFSLMLNKTGPAIRILTSAGQTIPGSGELSNKYVFD